MRTKKLLLIAAVAVMLVGATNAYGYHEWWSGWFNSGYLEYFGATFDYTNGEGVLEDRTYGSVDSFLVSAVCVSTFTCESGEYAGYYIKLWPDASGWKYTGQSGQKEVDNGEWSGYAILYRPEQPNKVFDPVEGTWNTTEVEGDCFDYDPRPPTYSADWNVTVSNPLNVVTGDGTCSGQRTYYEE